MRLSVVKCGAPPPTSDKKVFIALRFLEIRLESSRRICAAHARPPPSAVGQSAQPASALVTCLPFPPSLLAFSHLREGSARAPLVACLPHFAVRNILTQPFGAFLEGLDVA